ncbi:Bromodomain adjacent to zinc finger domain protein 1A [Galdieria sulphuraria]|nr:Bromodomain adjacent to zinc finger domain protein 1A [Galdieria sulphuraria]
MPLYNRKPFQPTTVTEINPKAQYFYLNITGEVFQDYESYLERLLTCKSRNWTCSITGKSGLTFQEALASEKETSWKLVDAAYVRFKKYYCVGERLIYNGKEWQVTNILSNTGKPFKEKRAEEFIQLSSFQLTYQLKDLEHNEITEISSSELVKKNKSPVSKVTLKFKIREISSREQQKEAPLLVKPELADKFGLIWFDPTIQVSILNCQDNDGKGNLSYHELVGNGTSLCNCRTTDRWIHLMEEVIRSQDECLWPEPIFSSKIPSHVYGDVVYVWEVAHVFGDQLGLVPFSLFDLEKALCYHDRNALLDCLFHQLVILSLENHEDVPESSGSRMKSDAERKSGWENVLVRIVRFELQNISGGEDYLHHIAQTNLGHKGEVDSMNHMEYLLSRWIEDKGYQNLNASERLVFLRMLCDIALGAEPIRKLVESELEEMQDKRKRKRMEIIEERQSLEREMEKAKQTLDKYRKSHGMKENGNMCSNHEELFGPFKDSHILDDSIDNVNTNDNEENNKLSAIRTRTLSKRQKTLREEKLRQERREKESEARNEERKLVEKIALLEKKYRASSESLGKQLGRSVRSPFLRWHPLGVDRCLRRYWLLEQEGILFVEVPEMRYGISHWGFYNSRKQLRLLYEYLNERVSGEALLKKHLDRRFSNIVHMMKRREAMKESMYQSKRLRSRQDDLEQFLCYPNVLRK